AMQSILSELVRQGRLVGVEDFAIDAPKTKALVAKLKDLNLDNVLIVRNEVDESLYLAARNLANVEVRDVQALDPVSLVRFEKLLMTVPAVKQVEEWLS